MNELLQFILGIAIGGFLWETLKLIKHLRKQKDS
jgi:hypothetical protein